MFKNYIRLMLYFLSFIAVGIIAVFVLFKLVDFEEKVTVPSLIGKSITGAEELLIETGFSLEVTGEEHNEKIPKGLVLKQDIEQGKRIKKGSGIKVVVSSGKEQFTTPYFEDMDIKDVKMTLKKLGMETGKTTWVHSDHVARNRVITQRPLPGYFSDNKVNLVVSKGPYDVSYTCPLFIDMAEDEARSLAGALGLKLIVKDVGRVVVLQKPEAGAVVKKGDTVEITLGRGGGFWF